MARLDNWQVQIVDEATGRLLSAPSKLGAPVQNPLGVEYQATVNFVRVQAADNETRRMLVRLVPPKDSVAPTLIGDFAAVTLGPSPAGIELTSPLPTAVEIEGQTAEGGSTRPVPATVTLTATRLVGLDQGLFASFARTVQVKESGVFSISVPPGDYTVDAIPEADSAACDSDGCTKLAAMRTTWQVAATPDKQAGKLLSFPIAPTISGRVISTNGAPVSGAPIRANPSPFNIPMDAWNRADGRGGSPVPGTVGDLVDGEGRFALVADPGIFDLFIQPDPSTRFAWFVRPVLPVGNSLALGALTLPLPVSNVGHVSIGATGSNLPATTSLIRAYVFITREGEYASAPAKDGAVIQVAETRTDDTGRYELLIPARLDSVPPGSY
jgi:hypothetical protein